MKWATRANIHIDRAACAWLIRRHIDPDAEFVFVTDPTSSQFTAFVATVTDIFQWTPQTSTWNPMGPANPPRPVGPFEAVLDRNVTPPKYIASRVRGFAGSNDATNTRYVLYMTILTDRSDII